MTAQDPEPVALRDVTEDDVAVFFEHQLDPEATRMAAFPSREEAAFRAHWLKIIATSTLEKRTILSGGAVAGHVVCWEQDGEPLVGYWIGRPFWGRGIATRALALFLGEVRRRPLFARVAKHNVGSIRVLEKCGFIVTGETREPAGAGGAEIVELRMKLEGPAG